MIELKTRSCAFAVPWDRASRWGLLGALSPGSVQLSLEDDDLRAALPWLALDESVPTGCLFHVDIGRHLSPAVMRLLKATGCDANRLLHMARVLDYLGADDAMCAVAHAWVSCLRGARSWSDGSASPGEHRLGGLPPLSEVRALYPALRALVLRCCSSGDLRELQLEEGQEDWLLPCPGCSLERTCESCGPLARHVSMDWAQRRQIFCNNAATLSQRSLCLLDECDRHVLAALLLYDRRDLLADIKAPASEWAHA